VLRLAFAFDSDGRLPYDTILYSCIKKSGKTTLNGAVTLAWGFTQEAPNEILILANDLEQTLARVFRTMEGIIQAQPRVAARSRSAEQALSTVAVENPRGWRIAKEKASRKIDAIVALAMACVAAMEHRGEIGSRSARGFNRAMHVSREKIVPLQGAPVYIGQTLVEVPATVIAQSDRGSIRVLAAFASEGMGLRRHVETIVKPWLAVNARWALNNHRLLLGAYEDVEQQNEFDLLQIVEDLLGGYWEKPLSKWEGRRDGVLDLIGKATPGTFQPSLQIDGTAAKLLIEALSGRWSYDTDRREKRTVWYHVANAFSLLVSTIAPMPSNEQIKVISNYDR
jgi:hypothetical protein